MHKDHHIDIHEITRIEGHGNVVIDIKNGRIKKLALEIIESPRFFEAMLRGRRFDEAQHIMSRICGICAVSHTSASLKAIESAMGMKISKQARFLRELAFAGETLQSHILHLYFLVLPDFMGLTSVIPLMKSNPDMVRVGLRLKNLANKVSELVAGRPVHPISLWPGGVVHTPKKEGLKNLKKELTDSFELLEKTLELFMKFQTPSFHKNREFISLKTKGRYSLYHGNPFSNNEDYVEPEDYTRLVSEYVVSHSTAKHAKTRRGAYMVGALARLNNNFKRLSLMAKRAAKKLNIQTPCHNPFMNNHAQLVECFHLTEDAINLLDRLLELGPKPERPAKPKTFGRGIGLVEAPRGTLYHDYTINKHGIVEKANCIIPTAQNLYSIEEDLRALVPLLIEKPKGEIAQAIETLVRAYDPCISCSTHIMNVRFV